MRARTRDRERESIIYLNIIEMQRLSTGMRHVGVVASWTDAVWRREENGASWTARATDVIR